MLAAAPLLLQLRAIPLRPRRTPEGVRRGSGAFFFKGKEKVLGNIVTLFLFSFLFFLWAKKKGAMHLANPLFFN